MVSNTGYYAKERQMKKTRFSLFYLAGYLIPAGLLLLFAPTFSTRLLLSNGDYGDVFPRLAGMLLIGIGVLVVQIIRLHLDMLYTTTVAIRLFFCICFIVFYLMSQDPFFLVLLVIVAFGLILTGTSYVLDRRDKSA
jgi:uncharacterized protein YjeT (DUF2065 family)